jgi:hypothetical protein
MLSVTQTQLDTGRDAPAHVGPEGGGLEGGGVLVPPLPELLPAL